MAGTSEGSRKIAQLIREKYGVDENGKSIFYKELGRKLGKRRGPGYFGTLAKTPEGRKKLREISSAAGKKSQKKAHQ